ncbi:MAG: hypothetical protein HYZ38_12825 [Mycobacterium sp.]|nr:hypothetical protein [Mycobacterium sp.]
MATSSPPTWPGIGRPIQHEELPGHLFDAASLHARRALANASSDLALLDRATSIGGSLELLAKSALAYMNPLLLAEDRQSKHLLLLSGFGNLYPEKLKTRSAADCMTLLNQAHKFDYNAERDAAVFDVRNLAVHLGFVDPSKFEPALNIMVALSDQILAVITSIEPSLDRTAYWGSDFLPQVDERLKVQAEVRRLQLEQLKAAALNEIERLRSRGVDDDVLSEWADREPPGYFDGTQYDRDERFVRRECPVCKFRGWLEYTISRGHPQYEYDDDDTPGQPYVEVESEPQEFTCAVCNLRLGSELLYLEDMGETLFDVDDAWDEEISAAEEAAVDRYYESLRED